MDIKLEAGKIYLDRYGNRLVCAENTGGIAPFRLWHEGEDPDKDCNYFLAEDGTYTPIPDPVQVVVGEASDEDALVSECCGSSPDGIEGAKESGICPDCKEHTEFVKGEA